MMRKRGNLHGRKSELRIQGHRHGRPHDFRQGDAARMPFEDETFDFIICRAAFKNFAQPITALDEMNRVLKTGGKALILDLPG